MGGLAWRSFSSGVEQAAKDQATETVARMNWPAVLVRELEQIRGTERQELRFTSYGQLWAKMRPLAIYDDSPINRDTMRELSRDLSNWYFSETGGLLLTTHNRELYFVLQEFLNTVARGENWEAERIDDMKDMKERFEKLLERGELVAAQKLKEHLRGVTAQDWPSDDLEEMVKGWRTDIRTLVGAWPELDSKDRFAVLQ